MKKWLIIFLMTMVMSSVAQGVLLLDNGECDDSGLYLGVSGENESSGGFTWFQPFTITDPGWKITAIGVAGRQSIISDGSSITGTVVADMDGRPDEGNPIANGSFLMPPEVPACVYENFDFTLLEGRYWVIFSPGTPDTYSLLCFGSRGERGFSRRGSDGAEFSHDACTLRIIGQVIPEPALVVDIDIKPGSCPNPLNVDSKGVLPVAILGSQDFDVSTIDVASVRLASVAPIRSSYEDVAGPVWDGNECECTTEGPDGYLDLTLKFKTQRIVEAVGDVNDGDVRVLTLTGVLFDPMSFETPIEGADCILIRGRYKPINRADINKDGVVDVADFAIFAENWLQCSVVQD